MTVEQVIEHGCRTGLSIEAMRQEFGRIYRERRRAYSKLRNAQLRGLVAEARESLKSIERLLARPRRSANIGPLPSVPVAAGQSYLFAPTLATLTLSKVTASRVSWPNPIPNDRSASTGRNRQGFVTIALKEFHEGIADGTYVLHEGGQK
jgi:hypothetical protein